MKSYVALLCVLFATVACSGVDNEPPGSEADASDAFDGAGDADTSDANLDGTDADGGSDADSTDVSNATTEPTFGEIRDVRGVGYWKVAGEGRERELQCHSDGTDNGGICFEIDDSLLDTSSYMLASCSDGTWTFDDSVDKCHEDGAAIVRPAVKAGVQLQAQGFRPTSNSYPPIPESGGWDWLQHKIDQMDGSFTDCDSYPDANFVTCVTVDGPDQNFAASTACVQGERLMLECADACTGKPELSSTGLAQLDFPIVNQRDGGGTYISDIRDGSGCSN